MFRRHSPVNSTKMQKSLAALSPALRSLIALRQANPVRSVLFSSAPDFLPSYLVTKCSLSPEKAAKASEHLRRRVHSPEQLDSVVSFYQSHGFNGSHFKRLLSTFPGALGLSLDETLAPKFHALRELGFTGTDLATLVCSNPTILSRSMENQVVPMINLWRRVFGSHHRLLMKCLSSTRWQIMNSGLNKTLSNISLLHDLGLSDHQISIVVSKQPYIITQKPESLNELVSRVETLGQPRGSPNFHWALYTLSNVNEDNLQPKIELFKGFGWSDDDFTKAFRRSPGFFTSSLKVLKEKMEFFITEAGCTASYIALNPVLLTFSLEKRLIPRVRILKALKEKGFSAGDHKLLWPMKISNIMFFERYVAPYKKEIPELGQLFSASSLVINR